ncbi:hypothetical protein [Maridesulfovibrio ferrireducens]|uniref:hypothetical protein n=1 Tax=Maridesulfovibrio ferrireducens TaxID=246191 RepID=UPI0026F10994|nr:hypothetical protein [Maridesulfovibrio ferrireducens]
MFESLLRETHCDYIGILGDSAVVSSLVQLLRESKREEDDIKLIAGVLADYKANGAADDFDIPIYEQVEDMITSHPEITMVFELSGDHSSSNFACSYFSGGASCCPFLP